MHKRDDAERAIRDLALQWMHETEYVPRQGWYPSFSGFTTWLDSNNHGHYLNFRSQVGARHEAEGWFEAEIRDYWIARQV